MKGTILIDLDVDEHEVFIQILTMLNSILPFMADNVKISPMLQDGVPNNG